MDQNATADLHHQSADTSAPDPADGLVETDDLIEEISIDGMCGVY
ncbi:mycofactocin precursor MftA [Streptomyces sp. NPDC023723]